MTPQCTWENKGTNWTNQGSNHFFLPDGRPWGSLWKLPIPPRINVQYEMAYLSSTFLNLICLSSVVSLLFWDPLWSNGMLHVFRFWVKLSHGLHTRTHTVLIQEAKIYMLYTNLSRHTGPQDSHINTYTYTYTHTRMHGRPCFYAPWTIEFFKYINVSIILCRYESKALTDI